MRRSLSLITMSTSSASGSTATVAAEVWMRPWRFGHRHALDAMDAAFEFQLGVGAAALHFQGRVLDAAQIAFGAGPSLRCVQPCRLAIALIHAQQIGGEQGRLVAAGAGADFHDGRGGIGGVPRQQLDLQFVIQRRPAFRAVRRVPVRPCRAFRCRWRDRRSGPRHPRSASARCDRRARSRSPAPVRHVRGTA